MTGHLVLVVDDDKQIARLLTAYLERAGFAVVAAYDGASALAAMRSARPDAVVLDLMLPGRDGWSVTREARADRTLATVPILMLTARVEDDDKIAGLELGADDYVTKPFNPDEVVSRVRALIRRSQTRDGAAGDVLIHGALVMDVGRRTLYTGEQHVDLTPTEFEMLAGMLRAPGRAFSRLELLEAAGDRDGLERTVDSHVKNMRRKLASAGCPDVVETVYGIGYRLSDWRSHPPATFTR